MPVIFYEEIESRYLIIIIFVTFMIEFLACLEFSVARFHPYFGIHLGLELIWCFVAYFKFYATTINSCYRTPHE